MSFSKHPVLLSIRDTGLWKFFPLLIAYSIGLAILFPIVPFLVSNAFASSNAGYKIDCQAHRPASTPEPQPCVQAHTQAVTWTSWTSFVSSSILSFLLSPVIGGMSDLHGRKPFILLGLGVCLLPMLAICMHIQFDLPIFWYFATNSLNGCVSSFNMCMVAVADLLPTHHRATASALLLGCFSVGILIGPMVGGFLSPLRAASTCIAMTIATIVYCVLWVPETAPNALRNQKKDRRHAGQHVKNDAVDIEVLGGVDGEDGYEGHDGGGEGGHAEDTVGRAGYAFPMMGATDPELEGAYEQLPDGCVSHGPPAFCHKTNHPETKHTHSENHSSHHHHPHHAGDSITHRENAHAHVVHHNEESFPLSSPPPTPQPASQKRRGRHAHSMHAALAQHARTVVAGWKLILSSSWYVRIACIWLVVAMTFEGAQDMMLQYLQLRLGFTQADTAVLLMIAAGCGIVSKLLLLLPSLSGLPEQFLLMFALCAYALDCAMLACAGAKWVAMLAVVAGSFGYLAWPALMAIQSSRVVPEQQGLVNGALSGLSALSQGVGPLIFAALFTAFGGSNPDMPYAPYVPWVIAASLAITAVGLTVSLHFDVVRWEKTKGQVVGEELEGACRERGGGGLDGNEPLLDLSQ